MSEAGALADQPVGPDAAATELVTAPDAAVVVDGISKRYARLRPRLLTRRTSSIFGSRFGRRATDWGAGVDDDDDLDDDDDDDDEEDAEHEHARAHTGEDTFWALRDVSFTVPAGRALALLGGRAAGKTTLLRILAGQSFPTEGTVWVRGSVSLFAGPVAGAMRGGGDAARMIARVGPLFGLPSALMREHAAEIADFAGLPPGVELDRRVDPTGQIRLALAAAAVIPSSVIVLDELPRVDQPFTERLIERIRARLDRGDSLVLASRRTQIAAELADEAVWLEDGVVVERGTVDELTARVGATRDRGGGPARSTQPFVPGEYVPAEGEFRVPTVFSAFNNWGALHACELHGSDGSPAQSADTGEELVASLRLEIGRPNIEARCGFGFMPSFGGVGIRVEQPDPIRFLDPGTYVLTARIPPGTLRADLYDTRADAVLASPVRRRATVIVRDGGRIRIVGETHEVERAPFSLWDGDAWELAEAEWLVEQEAAKVV